MDAVHLSKADFKKLVAELVLQEPRLHFPGSLSGDISLASVVVLDVSGEYDHDLT